MSEPAGRQPQDSTPPSATADPNDPAEPLDAAEQDPAPVPGEGSSGYGTSAPAYESDTAPDRS